MLATLHEEVTSKLCVFLCRKHEQPRTNVCQSKRFISENNEMILMRIDSEVYPES